MLSTPVTIVRKGFNVNRAERLTHILEFLKGGMSFSIDEITKKYRVSNRTVFRDIRTLKKLGYEVNFDNGYNLAESSQRLAVSELSDLQLDLIGFALKTHPLRNILPLTALSEKISDSFSEHSQSGFFKAPNQKSFDFNLSLFSKTSKDEAIITNFINAAEQNQCVYIKTKSGKYKRKLRPAGIDFGLTNIQLLVWNDSLTSQVQVSLNDILRIKIVAKSGSPAGNSK